MLGNLARSAEDSEWVADYPGVVDDVTKIAAMDNTAFQHSALGTLKNLAVAPANKLKLLAQPAVVDSLLVALESPQGPVQYMALTILRGLCIGQEPSRVVWLGARPGLLERLVHLSGSEVEQVPVANYLGDASTGPSVLYPSFDNFPLPIYGDLSAGRPRLKRFS